MPWPFILSESWFSKDSVMHSSLCEFIRVCAERSALGCVILCLVPQTGHWVPLNEAYIQYFVGARATGCRNFDHVARNPADKRARHR